MLSLILILVLIWQVYKAANESGRNGILWAVGAFIGSVVLQVAIGLVLGFTLVLMGWPVDRIESFTWPIAIFVTVVNVLLLWLLIRYLSKVKEEDMFQPPPPPPPPSTFN